MSDILESLNATIQDRKTNPTPDSYTASLFEKGLPKIAQKVGEEAVETVIASLAESDERLLSEMADMVYHSLVLLAARDLSLADLEAELAARFR